MATYCYISLNNLIKTPLLTFRLGRWTARCSARVWATSEGSRLCWALQQTVELTIAMLQNPIVCILWQQRQQHMKNMVLSNYIFFPTLDKNECQAAKRVERRTAWHSRIVGREKEICWYLKHMKGPHFNNLKPIAAIQCLFGGILAMFDIEHNLFFNCRSSRTTPCSYVFLKLRYGYESMHIGENAAVCKRNV